MDLRRNLYVSGFVAGSCSYIFNSLAFTGTLDLFRWFVFAAVFLGIMFLFEKFIGWAERFDN